MNLFIGYHKDAVYQTVSGERLCAKFNRLQCHQQDSHFKNGDMMRHRCTFVVICCQVPRLCLERLVVFNNFCFHINDFTNQYFCSPSFMSFIMSINVNIFSGILGRSTMPWWHQLTDQWSLCYYAFWCIINYTTKFYVSFRQRLNF